ncbi:MAG: DUF2339 domain-containing protein [Xanthomonadales bacterium]|nr:DUF2339 domain-containing protein [Xanthomonadales bacterium]
MELLGLFAVLLVLYLLIAPAVAWIKANGAINEAQELVTRQAREVSDLRKEMRQLREQHAQLLQRVERLGEGPAPADAETAAAATAPTPTPAPVSGRAVFTASEPKLPPPLPTAPPQPTVILEKTASAASVDLADTPPLAPNTDAVAVPIPDEPVQARWNPPRVQEPVETPAAREPMPQPNATAEAAPTPARSHEPAAKPKPTIDRPAPRPAAPHEPDPVTRLLTGAKDWLFGGNLVARIGLMILFIGVAFLLRFASNYVVVPIEMRLTGIAAGAIALLGWGWHIRTRRPGIALPTQGAALATLMLVVFGAYKFWHLLPTGATFGLLLTLVAFTCVLAVLQDGLWLAIFGIVGGFAVPILVSSGSGNHVALFGYYALLNAGIFAIAWTRAWRVLNFLGFLFTFLIGTAWGVQRYEAEHYQSSQGFLALFVAMYAAIAILYAWRQAPRLKSYVDATLVFGVPIVAMGLQYGMVKDMHLGSALSAVAFGVFYASLGLALWRWRAGSLRLLVESFFALAVVFGTLAIPLAFDGRWTSAAWALQGAGMVWVGLRQKQALVWRFGILLQFGAWIAFLRVLTGIDPLRALTEHISLGFLLLGATGVFLALTLRRQSLPVGDDEDAARARFSGWAGIFIAIAVIWLLGGLWVEVWLRVHGVHRASLYVLTAMLLVYGLQWLGRRADWRLPAVLAGAVTAVAGLTFLGLMTRYMRWHNVPVYPEVSLGEVLSGGALFGGLLLSIGALVSAFAFKRRWQSGTGMAQERDRSASVAWLWLSMFWCCGFALHGAAHALAFATGAAAAAPIPWYQVSFWAAYGIGLALSGYGFTALAQRFAFANAANLQRIAWPLLTVLGSFIFLVQVADSLVVERLLQFDWALPASGDGSTRDAWLAFAGGPLSGTLVLLALAWLGLTRLRDAERSPALSEHQHGTAAVVWLIGLGILLYLPLVDVLAQFGARLLEANGLMRDESSWFGYADWRLACMTLLAMAALFMARACATPLLRLLAVPTMVMQALVWMVLLADAYLQQQLPSPGTAIAVLLCWAGMAWCLQRWQTHWEIPDGGLKGLHFSRVVAPWLMLAPVVSLNLMPWLAGDPELALQAQGGWVVAGMWPDYLAAWAAIACLFLGLMQVRRGGWPLQPLHDWYGRTVIPLAALWALLLVIYWNLRQDGNMAPLPYLPLLNPLDLSTGFVALLLADLWRLHRERASDEQHRLALRTSMALGFGWFNLMLLRTAAKYLDLPYRFEPLFHSQFVQAMLSLTWTLCAFALMRHAARRLSKPLWMIGAALLGVVVFKLFIVDLRNVGSVARIVSFMGVGGLMLLIGYVAPLPREAEQ